MVGPKYSDGNNEIYKDISSECETKVKNILTATFVDHLRTGKDLIEQQRIKTLLK